VSSHITRYKNNKKIAIVKLFLIIIALNRSRYLVNSQTQGPRIYSWVEFGARNTPNLIPRNSNLILYAISIRFVIITVSATVQISDFRFQNWPIFREAETPPSIGTSPPGPLSWIACPERRRGKRGKRGRGNGQ